MLEYLKLVVSKLIEGSHRDGFLSALNMLKAQAKIYKTIVWTFFVISCKNLTFNNDKNKKIKIW